MYKLANQVIDAYDDIHLEHIAKLAAARPDCKILSQEQYSKLPSDAFAVTVLTKEGQYLPKFPLCDKDQTWLSQEMFKISFSKLPEGVAKVAAHHIGRACEAFGVPVSEEAKILAGMAVKTASAKSTDSSLITGLVYEDKAGLPIGEVKKEASARSATTVYADLDSFCGNYINAQYAMPSPEHVKLAAVYFEEKHKKMPLELRHKYAAHIQIRASELGMQPVKGEVSKYASDRYSALVGSHILHRQKLLDGSPLGGELSKIASMKESLTPYQFAQLLYEFDKKAGLAKFHDVSLENPFRATFAAETHTPWSWKSTKVASRELTEEELRSLVNTQNPKIASYFGKEVADGLKKDPQSVFTSLPMDAKEIMGQIHDGLL